jgi:Arc/MetJ-type ribon-helix-helix transcriptional regulator
MSKPFNPADLPEDIALAAAAQVAAGRFSTVEDVLRAGVEAVTEDIDFMRARFEAGRAAVTRGDLIRTTPKEFIDGIRTELGLK